MLVQALRRLDSLVSVLTWALTLVFGGSVVAAVQNNLPIWGPVVAFAAILFIGFLQSTYEESQRVASGFAFDASRLKRYESRDRDRLIFKLSPSKDYAFQLADRRDEEGYTEHRVPYDGAYDGYPGSRTTFSVGALGGEFAVVLGHQAYQEPDPRDASEPVEPFDIETHLYVVKRSGEEESVLMRLGVFGARNVRAANDPAPFRPRWGYAVSGTAGLADLPEGEYAFEVHDRTNAPGRGIVFRYMHLAVYKVGGE